MADFSWKRDLGLVAWRATLYYNLLRAFSTGVVLCVIALLMFNNEAARDAGAPSVGFILTTPLTAPIAYLFWLPIGLVCGALARMGVRWIGWVNVACAFIVVPGDPLVWLLKRTRPDLVPVERPGFFDFHFVIFVLDEEKRMALAE